MSTRLRQRMLVGLGILLGASSCQMTMTELKALNPSAATLEVHCHPSVIPENVQRFAVQRGTGHIVTDEQQDELRNVAPLASVFIEVNPAAPMENARVMASDYGLGCPSGIEAIFAPHPSNPMKAGHVLAYARTALVSAFVGLASRPDSCTLASLQWGA